MQYGSGVYDMPRNYHSSPVPRMRPEAYDIASKHVGSGMYACLNHPKKATTFASQNKVSMDEGPMRHAGVRSPIVVDPIYNGGKYSNRSARPVARVKPEAAEIATKSKGCMDVLFGNYGKPDPAMVNNTIEGDIDPRAAGTMKRAGIRAPILADPIYKEQYTGRTPRPAARVKPEASEIATKSMGGTVAKLFTAPQPRRYDERPKSVPHPGVRSSVFPQQRTPKKDQLSENVRRMRRIQRESQRRESEVRSSQQTTPVKALWKSSQYDAVESRVKPLMQEPPRAPRPGSSASSVTEPTSSKPVNFVARNARAAKTHQLRRSRSQQALNDSANNYRESLDSYDKNVRGKTPSYLQTRQRRWEEEERERIRNQPDPTVPEGHTVLPDQERKDTLANLRKYAALPEHLAALFDVVVDGRGRGAGLVPKLSLPDDAYEWADRKAESVNRYLATTDYNDEEEDKVLHKPPKGGRVSVRTKDNSPVMVYAPGQVENQVHHHHHHHHYPLDDGGYRGRYRLDDDSSDGSAYSATLRRPLTAYGRRVRYDDDDNNEAEGAPVVDDDEERGADLSVAGDEEIDDRQRYVVTRQNASTYQQDFQQEPNRNSLSNTGFYLSAQPTLLEYATGNRSWSVASRR